MKQKFSRSAAMRLKPIACIGAGSFLIWAIVSAADQTDAISREVSVMASAGTSSEISDSWSEEVSVLVWTPAEDEFTDSWSDEVSVLIWSPVPSDMTDSICREVSVLSCAGDVNDDHFVDPLDAGFVLSRFNCVVGNGDLLCDTADLNSDGIVDPLDVGAVLSRFGECPE